MARVMRYQYDNPLKPRFGTIWYMLECLRQICATAEWEQTRTYVWLGDRVVGPDLQSVVGRIKYRHGTVIGMEGTNHISAAYDFNIATVKWDDGTIERIEADWLKREERRE